MSLIRIRTRNVVGRMAAMFYTEAVRWRRGLPAGRCRDLRTVGCRSRSLERRLLSMPSRQRVTRRTVSSGPDDPVVRKVAWTGTTVAGQSGVTDAEVVGWTAVVRTARIVVLLSDESWQSVTRSRTAVRCRYRTTRLRVLVHHSYTTTKTVVLYSTKLEKQSLH